MVAAVAVRGGQAPAGPPAAPPLTTATVVRANLATTVLTAGTLGYAATDPVVNQLAGTYTSLPSAGQAIRPGQDLYRVGNLPVVLMRGPTPAWRTFTPGMTGGPDVTELQHNLIALGYAAGLFAVPTGQFDALTEDAVVRWQQAAGYPVTGEIALGQVVFLPAEIIVGGLNVAPGQPATPGQIPYQVTAASRTVTVPLTPDLPAVSTGQARVDRASLRRHDTGDDHRHRPRVANGWLRDRRFRDGRQLGLVRLRQLERLVRCIDAAHHHTGTPGRDGNRPGRGRTGLLGHPERP